MTEIDKKQITVSDTADDLLHWAWTIIANAGGGDWEKESDEWQSAVVKFRQRYHAYLDAQKHIPC